MLCTWLFAAPIAAVSRILHRRMGADPARFFERLGHDAATDKTPVLWFHAASLGEVIQIRSLAQHLARSEDIKLLVTTATSAGADWVAREMPEAVHRFAPIDTPAAVGRFLDGWSISAAIFVEGDLWPRLLLSLESRGIPQILLNARHSRTRARLPAVFETLLAPFSLITCRSEAVANSMVSLGLSLDQVHVLPDLRLTLPKLEAPNETLAPLRQALGERPVWLAASTHPADEEGVLAAHQEVLKTHPDALLILAPRHPKRGLPLNSQAQTKNLRAAQRSLNENLSMATQVYIADTLGELGVFFSLSPIVFLGGSFGTEGGHNPYEPAKFGTALIAGPHVKNFTDAYAAMSLAGGAIQVEEPTNLGEEVLRLMSGNQAQSMAQAGLAFMEEAQDSTLRYAHLITEILRHK